ncbi:MAG: hypothetical protein IAE65_02470 [Ignavibacteria bacterium]|nr:hypothetical protein [Ignavibacteria bacterium]
MTEPENPKKVSKLHSDHHEFVVSFMNIRRMIGILGIALPIVCLIINYAFLAGGVLKNSYFVHTQWSDEYQPSIAFKPSISDYYYTPASVLFTGTLITISIFLFCFHEKKDNTKNDKFPFITDNLMTNIAAVSLLFVALFPTSPKNKISDNIYNFTSSDIIGSIHLFFACIFFISVSILCIVNFRRTGNSKHFGKTKSDKVYLFCGIGMLFTLLAMIVYKVLNMNKSSVVQDDTIFVLESIMLILFGTAWLTKGKVNDTKFVKRVKETKLVRRVRKRYLNRKKVL